MHQPQTFTGPDGAIYAYADPTDSPDMDEVDSTSIPPVEATPGDHEIGRGESTPAEGAP